MTASDHTPASASEHLDLVALLPCPFCGGEAQTDFINDIASHRIECFACDATGQICDSQEGAIAAWNRRATPKGTSGSDALDARGVKMVRDWIDEALTYVGSPSWSPSMVSEGKRILAAIAAQAEGGGV
jgi:Lar family restriction alleviation protein